MTGDYLETLAFMDAVERLPYSIVVTTIDFRSMAGSLGPDSLGSAQTRAEMSGVVYWLSRTAPDFLNPPTDAPSR
jgi:hypothetical protein